VSKEIQVMGSEIGCCRCLIWTGFSSSNNRGIKLRVRLKSLGKRFHLAGAAVWSQFSVGAG
jgi:hypothetical protein